MPSIPQSLLWVSLVVLWLFVLVPMLVNKRDAVRRTSDVALATRVLNGTGGARLLKRGGPAVGHRSDPEWRCEKAEYAEPVDSLKQEEELDDTRRPGSVVDKAAAVDLGEPDYLDVEVISEDSAALPVGSGFVAATPVVAEEPAVAADAPVVGSGDALDDGAADGDAESDTAELGIAEHVDDYELVEDTAGLEPGEDPPPIARPASSRRRRYDSAAADAVSARKYKFRRRVLVVMALILVGSATAAFAGQSFPWRVCGLATGVTVLYLAYLRRQTRIEEQLRRRRLQRLSRSRFGTDNAREHEFEGRPSRSRHPDADLLEIDENDPMLEDLSVAMYSMRYGWPPDLPRAAGQ